MSKYKAIVCIGLGWLGLFACIAFPLLLVLVVIGCVSYVAFDIMTDGDVI
jgi:uncharacterized membrane protein YhdT